MKVMKSFLESEELPGRYCKCAVNFFAGSAGSMKKMGGLFRDSDGGGVAVECEHWTGNMLRMVRGALDAANEGRIRNIAELP